MRDQRNPGHAPSLPATDLDLYHQLRLEAPERMLGHEGSRDLVPDQGRSQHDVSPARTAIPHESPALRTRYETPISGPTSAEASHASRRARHAGGDGTVSRWNPTAPAATPNATFHRSPSGGAYAANAPPATRSSFSVASGSSSSAGASSANCNPPAKPARETPTRASPP